MTRGAPYHFAAIETPTWLATLADLPPQGEVRFTHG